MKNVNAFQMLKSGLSFKKEKIESVSCLFESKEKKAKNKSKVSEEEKAQKEINIECYESDKEIPEIDIKIEQVKRKLKTQTKPKVIKKYQDLYQHMINKRKETMLLLRKKYKVVVDGEDVPDLLDSFDKLRDKFDLSPFFFQKIKESHYTKPTPVQMQAIPVLFAKKNAIVLAETGSGKSLAFIMPMLHLLKKGDGLKAIVLAPTRELTIQLYKEFLMFSQVSQSATNARVKFFRKALFPKNKQQFDQLIKSNEILVSTPLKLAKLVKEYAIEGLEFLVIDEADKMFELGFLEQVEEVLSKCSNNQESKVCKFLFSATMQPGVEDVVRQIMGQGEEPIKVQVGIKNSTNVNIDQRIMYVGQEDGKLMTLRQILKDGFDPPMLIFVQSKERAKELFHELIYDGINVNVIHSDKKKDERDEIIKQFRMGKIWVLICTDLMSRGIDFKTVNYVVNYDFPQSIVSYIHRIGRTARAGKKGTAITFFTDLDCEFLRNVANLMKKSGLDVPEWMLSMKGATNKRWKELEKKPIRRKTISTDIKRNTNKRFKKILRKDAKKLNKLHQKYPNQAYDNGEDNEGDENEKGEGNNQAPQYDDDDEEIDSDEC